MKTYDIYLNQIGHCADSFYKQQLYYKYLLIYILIGISKFPILKSM